MPVDLVIAMFRKALAMVQDRTDAIRQFAESKAFTRFKECALDSVRYWERMRIAYNIVLATLALACWGAEIFSGRLTDLIAGLVVLTFFAVGANLCYCSAYPVDFVFQLPVVRNYRMYCRWGLFLCGTSLASVCALWVLLGDHMA